MEKFLTLQQAAESIGISTDLMRALIKAGSGPGYYRPSRKIMLFRETDLAEWQSTWRKVGDDAQ